MFRTVIFILLFSPWYFTAAGQISFTQEPLTTEVNIPYLIGAADLDGDNDNDILVSRRSNSIFGVSSSAIHWFAQTDSGFHFISSIYANVNASGFSTSQLFIADDLDGDTDNDVLIMERTSGSGMSFSTLFWMDNTESGFEQRSNIASLPGGLEIKFLVFDMDGDEDTDLLLYTVDSLFVDWYEYADTGFVAKSPFPTIRINGLITADLNQDGLDDIIILQDDLMVWHENLGGTDFSTFKVIDPTTIGVYEQLHAEDLDRDGDVDIVAMDFELGIFYYENDGDEGFEDGVLLFAFTSPAGSRMDFRDINRNGYPDLILYHPDEGLIWVENNGSLPFGSKHVIAEIYDGASNVLGAELSGDSGVDVLTASSTGGSMYWHRNNGDTTAPAAICVLATDVFLSASGTGTLTVTEIDFSSSDDVGIASLEISDSIFTCEDLGMTTVELTVTDHWGNASRCTSEVFVKDEVAPSVSCTDLEVNLSAGDSVVLTAQDLVTFSDNCGETAIDLNPAVVYASTEVTVTATDSSGNSTTCTSTVTVNLVSGLLETTFGIGVKLIPNPADSATELVLSSTPPFDYAVEICDIRGATVLQKNNVSGASVTLPLVGLSPGNYFIQLYRAGDPRVIGSCPLIVR